MALLREDEKVESHHSNDAGEERPLHVVYVGFSQMQIAIA